MLGLPVGKLIDGLFGPRYGVAVSYQYNVAGKEYASGSEKDPPLHLWEPPIKVHRDALNLGRFPDWSWSGHVQAGRSRVAYGRQEWAEATARKYVKGNRCLAYYNPANPSEAFLLHEYDFSPYRVSIIAAIVFLFTGCIIVVDFVRWQAGTLKSDTPLGREEYRKVGRWLSIPGLVVLGGCAWLLLFFFRRSADPLSQSRAPMVLSVVVGLLVCIYVACWFVSVWIFCANLERNRHH
jgi:hypothetical protein